MVIPAARYDACVRLEQSHVLGPLEPKTYAFPRWASAKVSAAPAAPEGVGTADVSPLFASTARSDDVSELYCAGAVEICETSATRLSSMSVTSLSAAVEASVA